MKAKVHKRIHKVHKHFRDPPYPQGIGSRTHSPLIPNSQLLKSHVKLHIINTILPYKYKSLWDYLRILIQCKCYMNSYKSSCLGNNDQRKTVHVQM